jgi:L-lactate dehydrogenase (cytochrome)
MIIANIADFREAARRRLPHFLFQYIDGGSFAEATLARNVSDLSGIALRQRVLKDVSDLDLSTELFSRRSALPASMRAGGRSRPCGLPKRRAFPLPSRRLPPAPSRKP